MHFALSAGAWWRGSRAHENIVGMKDSSGDPALLARLPRAQSARTSGCSPGSGTVRERPSSWRATARSSRSRCSRRRSRSTLYAAHARPATAPRSRGAGACSRRWPAMSWRRSGRRGVKCALDLVGLDGGPPRPPLLPCDAEERGGWPALLEDAGVRARRRSRARGRLAAGRVSAPEVRGADRRVGAGVGRARPPGRRADAPRRPRAPSRARRGGRRRRAARAYAAGVLAAAGLPGARGAVQLLGGRGALRRVRGRRPRRSPCCRRVVRRRARPAGARGRDADGRADRRWRRWPGGRRAPACSGCRCSAASR